MNINYFKKFPEEFWDYYTHYFNINEMLEAEPNDIHKFIKNLEEEKNVNIITQNIDKLHHKIGSNHIIEVHGNIDKHICLKCKKVYSNQHIKCEDCGNYLKPDIVLFGESIRGYDESLKIVRKSDLLLVLGTRLEVYPLNTLVDKFIKQRDKERKYKGGTLKKLIICNNDSTTYDRYANFNSNIDLNLLFKS